MVLVTGGTGLIGAHLIYQLILNGEHVRAIKREGSNISQVDKVMGYYLENTKEMAAKIEWVNADVLDIPTLTRAFDGVSAVYHCAATVSFDPRKKEHMTKVNLEGTANVVNLCLDNGNVPLSYVSSVAAIGRSGSEQAIDEETEWKDSPLNTAYAKSKHAAEMEVWRGMAEGLKVSVVNPTIVIGPGAWGKSSTSIFVKVWDGLSFFAPGINGFVDVRDVAEIMVKLMKHGPYGERFVVASESRKIGDVMSMIATEFGKKPPYIEVTPFLAAMAWRVAWLKSKLFGVEPVVTKETAATSINNNRYDNSKVKNALNVEFISIETSVKDTCRHFVADQTN